MPGKRSQKWRVEFNGLGDLTYCATVERTQELTDLLSNDILSRARTFIESLPAAIWIAQSAGHTSMKRRTRLPWSREEAASEDKARKFIQLLRQAHEGRELSEDYLVELQNAVINNALDKAAAFRHEQNYLSDGMQGAAGVTYLPPPPELCRELMESLMRFANEAPTKTIRWLRPASSRSALCSIIRSWTVMGVFRAFSFTKHCAGLALFPTGWSSLFPWP